MEGDSRCELSHSGTPTALIGVQCESLHLGRVHSVFILYRCGYGGGLLGGQPTFLKPVTPPTPAQLALGAIGGLSRHTHTHTHDVLNLKYPIIAPLVEHTSSYLD